LLNRLGRLLKKSRLANPGLPPQGPISLAGPIDDLSGAQCVLYGSQGSDVLGGVVFQDDQIRLETCGDSAELF
jgi:hypothetical protein